MSESYTVNDSEYWSYRYQQNKDGWELGVAAPPLVKFFQSSAMLAAPARVVVPGCGRGHEVLLLAEMGHDAVGVDFAETAIIAGRQAASQRQLPNASFLQKDFFAWALQPEWQGSFDVAVEHTCYCAIDPKRRTEYIRAVASVLRPGGLFVGLFWACGFAGGPPFTTDRRELEELFGTRFQGGGIQRAQNSIPSRAGQEWLVWGTRAREQRDFSG